MGATRSWYVLVEVDGQPDDVTLFDDFGRAARFFKDVLEGQVYLCRGNGTVLKSDFRVPLHTPVPMPSPWVLAARQVLDRRAKREMELFERFGDRARERALDRRPIPNNVIQFRQRAR